MAISPVPPLPDTARITEYAIVNSTGPFAVGFDLYGDNTDYGQWLEVWLNGVQLTPTAQWTLASLAGGSLATTARPIRDGIVTLVAASTGTLRILGAQRPRRLASYDEARAITARDENLDHNATRAIEREAWDGKSRILRVPPGETLAYLPPLAQRANMQAFFDNAGNLTAGTIAPPAVPISVAVAPLLNSATLSVFRNALNVRRVLDVTQFGAIGDGATDSLAAWQAAINAALPGEQIWVPAAAGAYVLSGATVQNKQLEWILEPGAVLTLTNAQRAFAGLNSPVNFPVDGGYGHVELLSRMPTQHGRYISVQFLDDGIAAIAYESCGLLLIAQTFDPLGGLVHDCVGISGRAYMGAEDTRGYAEHMVALIQNGIVNAGAIGFEVDVTNPASGIEINGYGTYQKIGGAFYSTGPKRGSRAIEIGLGGSAWFQGLHINAGAIDAGGYGISWDGRFSAIDGVGVLVAKDVSNRQTPGVELLNTGGVWMSGNGGVALVATRPGTPGPGVVLDISVQQQNSVAVIKNFADITGEVITATAGAEDGRISITGLAAGAGRTFAVIEGTRIGPGADNVTNAGSAGQRYKEIFCVNNVINTSDEREKFGVAPITDVVLDAWEEVSPQFYQWQASVAAKGQDKARIHAGYIAQRVIEAFRKHGLDPWRYALLCADAVMVEVKEVRTEKRQRMKVVEIESFELVANNGQMVRKRVKKLTEVGEVRKVPIYNEDGSALTEPRHEQAYDANGKEVMGPVRQGDGSTRWQPVRNIVQVPVYHDEPVYEDVPVEVSVMKDSGEVRYGLRPEQCAVLEGAMLRRRLARLEAKVGELTKPAAPAAQP